MPILARNLHRYPPDWPSIRASILSRASNRCERCGLPNHAVGYRNHSGEFIPLGGNGPCDAAGNGQSWPSLEPLSFEAARDFAMEYNCCGCKDEDQNRWIVIVLTVAHLNHLPEDNRPENLAALCQQCHNRHDAAHRQDTRRTLPNQLPLFDSPLPNSQSAIRNSQSP